MSGLLAGVRVLDLTNVLAGPYCGYQLALVGADVVKVEMPGSGDLARMLGPTPALNQAKMGASFLAQNAGKRSVEIDFKSTTGKEQFLTLVAEADVVLENFRPGVMDRLGLGYERLKGVRPGLIYCAISGFGQTGPLKDNPAYDQIIQGLSGIMSITGTPETAPLRVGYPVCDTLGGLFGAFAIAAALVRRDRTGEGAFLDVSMLESALSALGWPVSNYLVSGVQPSPMGNENFTASPSGAFATGEGLLNIAANKQEQFVSVCTVIGRPELASDPRFLTSDERIAHRYELRKLIEEALAASSAADWEARLNKAGVPAGRVLTVPQVLDEAQVKERDMAVQFEQVPHIDGVVTVVRGGFLVDGEAPRPMCRPPTLGEHNDKILAQTQPPKAAAQ
jgi:crotonobetainyl-CoA:carnitine CoA-transferase CaiB-like acyl-CoA transferase